MNPVERAEAELKRMEELNNPQPPVTDTIIPDDQQQIQTPPPQQQSDSDYEQQWKSLKGIVKKKDEQIQQLLDSQQALMDRINLMASSSAQPSTPQGNSVADLGAHLEDLVEEYGQPMITAIDRTADARFGSKIASLEAKIAELSGLTNKINEFEQRQSQNDSEKFIARLAERVSDWKQTLDSPAFQDWKDTTVEPFTGRTFGDLFQAANDDWNLDGMVGVFNAFSAITKKQPQPQQQQPAIDPRAALVTPGSKSGIQSTDKDQGKVWKQSEVDQVYNNMRRGLYSAEEQMRLDRELFEANASGRVVRG